MLLVGYLKRKKVSWFLPQQLAELKILHMYALQYTEKTVVCPAIDKENP